MIYHSTQSDDFFLVSDFAWKKTKTHPNTKFLPIFHVVGTKKKWKASYALEESEIPALFPPKHKYQFYGVASGFKRVSEEMK